MEIIGILAAIASSSLGGLSVGVTRLVVGSTDPITLGAFRFGIGSLLLLPLAWRHRARWPNVLALAPIAGLGLLFFGLFPVLFNASLIYTTAGRGSIGAVDPSVAHDAGSGLPASRDTDASQNGGSCGGHHRGGRGVVHRTGLRRFECVARRCVDGRSRTLHGLLQCLVESVGKAIRSDPIYGPRHDMRRPRACGSGLDPWRLRSDRVIRACPVERCRVSRYIRRCPHVSCCGRTPCSERRQRGSPSR